MLNSKPKTKTFSNYKGKVKFKDLLKVFLEFVREAICYDTRSFKLFKIIHNNYP